MTAAGAAAQGHNIARHLSEMVAREAAQNAAAAVQARAANAAVANSARGGPASMPQLVHSRAALKVPRGRAADGRIDYLELSFAELEAEVDAWCARLCGCASAAEGHARSADCEQAGAPAERWRGVRTLVMLRQGLPLIAAVFALFKLGAVPIVIDPGMGLKNFLRCVARTQPRALIGIPLAQGLSRVFRGKFRSVRWRVAARGSLTHRLSKHAAGRAQASLFPAAAVAPDELAAILFTSGSTGAPKGVCYTHGMFAAQLRLIREHYAIAPGEVDLPMLPIFALFNPALGMTTVVPELDPRRPAQVDPARIVQAIRQESVSSSFGSPTLWLKIKRHCLAHGIQLPTLRRILCAGAPVPVELWQENARWLPNGQIHSPYGATEALPLCSISEREVASLAALPGSGACVGRALPGIELRIIEIVDAPLASLAAARELPCGEVGEIVAAGPVVTRAYDALPEATARAKVLGLSIGGESPPPLLHGGGAVSTSKTAGPQLFHRMGDAGYLDAQGRLWFCGRVVERVQTRSGPLYTEPCEQVFRNHAQVTRCALIGLGAAGEQVPALVVQAQAPRRVNRAQLAAELRELALAQPHTAAIERFYFHPNFPVDVRHNAKIHRHTLARWAQKARAYTASGT